MNFNDIKQQAQAKLPSHIDRNAILEALNLPSGRTSPSDALPLLAAFGIGALAGLAIGVLVAPRSGGESRQQLEKKSRQLQRSAVKKAQSAAEELS